MKLVLKVLYVVKIVGMVYIIGGGFVENIFCMFFEGLGVEIDYGFWLILYVFDFFEE